MNGIELTFAMSASAYITNKFFNYCCTPVVEHSTDPGIIERVQDQGNAIALWCESKFGTRAWSIISDVIVDNAWISLLVLGILLNRPYQIPLNPVSKAIVLVACGVTFCITAWAVRTVLTLVTPYVAEIFVNIVCPKRFRDGSNPDLDGNDQVFEPPLDPLAETSGYVP